MVKDILCKLGLEELIGTSIEKSIKIENHKNNSIIKPRGKALYIISGFIRLESSTVDARTFYSYYLPGMLSNIDGCFYNEKDDEFKTEILYKSLGDSVIALIPLSDIEKVEFPDKSTLLIKVLKLLSKKSIVDNSHLLGKILYKDSEFIAKAILNIGDIEANKLIELSRFLNINERNLIRCLKDMVESGAIEKKKGSIKLKNEEILRSFIK